MSDRLTDEDLARIEGLLKEVPIRSFVLLLAEVRASRAEIAGLRARMEKLVFEATLMASQARDLIRGKEEAGRWARAFEKLAALARGGD